MQSDRKGVTHAYPLEKLLAFRDVPPGDKLRWLQAMREFCDRFVTPEGKALLEPFRKGEL